MRIGHPIFFATGWFTAGNQNTCSVESGAFSKDDFTVHYKLESNLVLRQKPAGLCCRGEGVSHNKAHCVMLTRVVRCVHVGVRLSRHVISSNQKHESTAGGLEKCKCMGSAEFFAVAPDFGLNSA